MSRFTDPQADTGKERAVGVPGYFFREAFRRLWRSKRTTGVAISMIAISLVTLGFFLLISENLKEAVDRWEGGSQLRVYLKRDATPAEIREIARFFEDHADLRKNRFVTREQALVKFKQYFQSLSPVVAGLDENPFPPSYEIEVKRPNIDSSSFRSELEALRRMNGVDDVQFDWDWVSRLRRVVNVLNLIGLIIGGTLAVAATFTISNVIRLTMLMYREEIDIMRLVGATENIVRGPFLVEGILYGGLGAMVALAVLLAMFEAGARWLAPSLGFIWGFLFVTFLPWQKALGLIAGGILAGLVGSLLSVRMRSEDSEAPS
ncbi:MAG TPA: permease-like cell division protein FtsX [Thermoanaerobaculia bacterium]|nr:permease-like cell division protein FtsX [Thermoanaerobaculia bacterium]